MTRVLSSVAVCIIGIGVLLHIIGLATTEWSSLNINGQSQEAGLWKGCSQLEWIHRCVEYPLDMLGSQFANSIRACRAFAILGMLAGILGLVMSAVSVLFPILGKPNDSRFPVISLAGCVAAFIFILITIIVWAAVIHEKYLSELDIGYSFILSIVGGILIGVGGVLARLGKN